MKHKIETSIKNTEKPKYYIWVEKRELHVRKVDMYLGIKLQLPGDISTNNSKNTEESSSKNSHRCNAEFAPFKPPPKQTDKIQKPNQTITESKFGL